MARMALITFFSPCWAQEQARAAAPRRVKLRVPRAARRPSASFPTRGRAPGGDHGHAARRAAREVWGAAGGPEDENWGCGGRGKTVDAVVDGPHRHGASQSFLVERGEACGAWRGGGFRHAMRCHAMRRNGLESVDAGVDAGGPHSRKERSREQQQHGPTSGAYRNSPAPTSHVIAPSAKF